jgi:membrane-bound lytic murein transglycosylase D
MYLPGICISEKYIFLKIRKFTDAGNGQEFIMEKNFNGRRSAASRLSRIIPAIVFFTGIVSGAACDERPLRMIEPRFSYLTNFSHINSISLYTASDFPLLTESALEQALTQRYIVEYSSRSGIANLNAILQRGGLYLPFIMEEITKRNLPRELAFLPVIESNFLSTARSRSGAVGLWQFMMNSISPFNIAVNDFVDERRDIIKATRGALSKLEDNYRMLQDWPLALAAYNAGLGAVTRTIQRTNISDYWELCRRNEFRPETIHYVPKLLAVSYILSQPRRFGINYWPLYIEWTDIPLERQISLDLLAFEAGVENVLFRRLNAELLRGITPPDKNYRLKVPTAWLAQINEALERENTTLLRYHYHTVKYGDSIWALSREFNVPINLIEQHNPGITSRYLRIGETVVIPAFHEIQPQAATVREDAPIFEGRHTVQKGETLWSLARSYGIDPQALADANNMTLNDILSEGKTLNVPIIEYGDNIER